MITYTFPEGTRTITRKMLPKELRATVESVIIPEGVAIIAERAFEGCDALAKVTFPSTLTTISSRAFCECENLEDFTLPASVREIGPHAFTMCAKLRLLALPCVEYVCYNAFRFCHHLMLILPDGTFVPAEAFTPWGQIYDPSTCYVSCTLPAHYTEVPHSCFAWSAVREVTLHPGVRKIGPEAFDSCMDLHFLSIPYGVKEIGPRAFSGSGIIQIIIPPTVTKIGRGAFSGRVNGGKRCKELTIFGVPGSYAEEYAKKNHFDFYPSDSSPIEYTVATGLPAYTPQEGDDPCGCVWEVNSLQKLVIPEGVTQIAPSAFDGQEKLTEVTLPTTLRKIGTYAFYGCKALTSITIPEGVEEIGRCAFSDSSVTRFTLPGSLKLLDYEALGCTSLFSEPLYNKTICAPAGSYAEQYAKENDIPFEAI